MLVRNRDICILSSQGEKCTHHVKKWWEWELKKDARTHPWQVEIEQFWRNWTVAMQNGREENSECLMKQKSQEKSQSAICCQLDYTNLYFHFMQTIWLKLIEEWSENRSIDTLCIMRIREDELSLFDSFFITSGQNSMTKEWRWMIWEQLWKVSPNLVNVKRLYIRPDESLHVFLDLITYA